jgi:hypothetical protein
LRVFFGYNKNNKSRRVDVLKFKKLKKMPSGISNRVQHSLIEIHQSFSGTGFIQILSRQGRWLKQIPEAYIYIYIYMYSRGHPVALLRIKKWTRI